MEGLDLAWPLFAGLVGLALVDSTSIGTLGLPVFMLAQARIRASIVFLYLGTIAVFYWLLGVVLLLAADSGARLLEQMGEIPVLDWIQLAIGVALFAVSFRFDEKHAKRRAERLAREGKVSRAQLWKEKLTGEGATAGTAVATAFGAGVIEAASMLPYLGAVGLLTASGIGAGTGAVVLVGYCAVMIFPALVLFAVRVVAARWVEPLLERINTWFTKRSAEMLGWVLAIIGVLLALDALGRLPVLDALERL